MHNFKRGRIFKTRKRNFNWKTLLKKKTIIITGISIFSCIIIYFLIYMLYSNLNLNNGLKILKVTNNIDNDKNKNYSNDVSIYGNDNNIEQSSLKNENEEVYNNTGQINTDIISFNVLGQIVPDANIAKNDNYEYKEYVKDVYSICNDADFTYATSPLMITSVENLDNVSSKYIATKNICSMYKLLGIDVLNIATDRSIDYDDMILKNTINTLKSNNIYVSGLKDDIIYLQKGSVKIAIISMNNVYIGSASDYENANIAVYKEEYLKNTINIAKQNADIVLVDFYYGRENTFGVTESMQNMAKQAVECGADLVLGSNALGVYPIVKINNIPVIYSTNYFISSLDYTLSMQNFVFKFTFKKNQDNDNYKYYVSSLEMVPIYSDIINNKKVLKYFDYNSDLAREYIEQINNWNIQNLLDSKIVNDKIIVNF